MLNKFKVGDQVRFCENFKHTLEFNIVLGTYFQYDKIYKIKTVKKSAGIFNGFYYLLNNYDFFSFHENCFIKATSQLPLPF